MGEALRPIRDQVVIATKLHMDSQECSTREMTLKSTRTRLEASLQWLGLDYVDLYYQHRVNQDIPIEDVAYVMGELIKEGKMC